MSLKVEIPTVHACLKGMVAGGKGYGISHRWDGSVLTVTSDSGSSSADLLGPAGPAGDGAELFVVELSYANDKYMSDKSFAEIKAAIDDGKVAVCELIGYDSRTRCWLTTYTEYSATFILQSFLGTGADEYFTITADGVTHIVADSGDEEKVLTSVNVVKTDGLLTVTAAYGFDEVVTTIALDEDDVPVSVTKGGKTTALTWEGFDA